MSINVILATDAKGGIGKNNGLPWPHAPSDMKWFYENTKGDVVIMGSNTWRSIGSKRLPNRINIVVTRQTKLDGDPDCLCSGTLQDIISGCLKRYPDQKIWVIGGEDIYRQSIPLADHIFLTKFDNEYECDKFVDLDKILKKMYLMATKRSEEDKCTMSIWSRI